MLRALIAFANTAGGILIIGVEDGTKNVLGVSDPLKEEERLANLVSDRILPRLVPAIEIVTWRSLQVIVVEVYPSPNQPHATSRVLGLEPAHSFGSVPPIAARTRLSSKKCGAWLSGDETLR